MTPAASRDARAALRRTEPVLFLVSAFAMTLMLARSYLVQSDEGYVLGAAWQMWSGMRMYEDFRLFTGPGSGYAVYWLWRIIGSPSFLAARILSMVLSFLGTTGFYLLLRRLGIRGVGLATAVTSWLVLSSLCVLVNHNAFSTAAAIWFLLAFVRVVHEPCKGTPVRRRNRDYVLVGLAAGLVFAFLPMKGSLLALAATVYFLAVGFRGRDFRPILALCAGFLAVIAPLFVAWDPATLVEQWLVIPLAGNYLGQTSASLGSILVAVSMLVGMAWMATRFSHPVLKALVAVEAALSLGTIHNLETVHIAVNSFPLVVFVFFAIQQRAKEAQQRQGISSGLVMAAFAGTLAVWTVVTPDGRLHATESVLRADLLGGRPKLVIRPRVAEAHAIYAGPFLPGLYYLLQKRNPFFVCETVVCNDECQRRLVSQIEEVKPEIAFLAYDMISHLHYPEDGPVDVYLREHYTACPSYGWIPMRAISPEWCP